MIDYDINKIKMLISDIDGVWTDGSIYVGNKESEMSLDSQKVDVLSKPPLVEGF